MKAPPNRAGSPSGVMRAETSTAGSRTTRSTTKRPRRSCLRPCGEDHVLLQLDGWLLRHVRMVPEGKGLLATVSTRCPPGDGVDAMALAVADANVLRRLASHSALPPSQPTDPYARREAADRPAHPIDVGRYSVRQSVRGLTQWALGTGPMCQAFCRTQARGT
jgi:hypothetical protein